MKQLAQAIEAFAITLGGPGLFLVAYLDSSFLSLPQANDLFIVWMVLKHKHLMLYYAAMATLGSLAGCLTIYALARRGGEAFLRRRVSGPRVERGMRWFQKYGILAIVVPSLLPPPMPFKLFVLLAGVTQVPALQFTAAVAVGRGLRYVGVGLLTVYYGEAAIAFLQSHARLVWGALGAMALLGAGAWAWRHQRRGAA